MTPDELAAIVKLRDQYNCLHDNLDALLTACGDNDAQKRQVGDALQTALKNYIDAQNHILGKSDALVAQVTEEASVAEMSINAALKNLQNIKSVLNAITQAVNDVSTAVAALA